MKPRSARSPAASTSSGCSRREAPELSQTEMSAALGLPLPTVHRLTAAARRARLPRARPAHPPLPARARGRAPDAAAARRACGCPSSRARTSPQLAAETGETVNLAVLQDGEIVYLLSESGEPAAERAHAGRHAPARPLHRARQVPARPAARRDGARRRRPRALRAAHGRHAHDLGARCTPRSSASARDGSRSPGRSTRSGSPRSPCPVGWRRRAGRAALNVSLPTSRATPRVPQRARRAGCATIAARIEASLAAHGLG